MTYNKSVDFDRFVWRADEQTPGRYKREAGGAEYIEDLWNLTKAGEQNLFLAVYATLNRPMSADELTGNIRLAWKSLRWDVPTIASTTAHDMVPNALPTTYIVYTAPKSETEADAWAEATVKLMGDYTSKDLDALRYDVGDGPLPEKDYDLQTFLYVVPYSPTKFGVLLRTSHTVYDGSAMKILMTKLFTHLAKYIDEPSYLDSQKKMHKWGEEHKHLLPYITEILRTDGREEKREGDEYLKTLETVMAGLMDNFPLAHPFKNINQPVFTLDQGQPKNQRLHHTFSIADSEKIKAAGSTDRTGLSAKLTVNHLVHGALNLLPLIDNPPSTDTNGVVYYYGLADGRQRLAKDYRGPLGYPGYCLGVSVIAIPIAELNSIPDSDMKGKVINSAKAIQREYKIQAEIPNLIAIEPAQVELMVSGPPPPPWCGPWYSADGRGSLYLQPKYPDAESGSVIVIDDFWMGLNKTDPGPFFRATEWNGKIMLSADFNEKAVKPEVAKKWMDKWIELLLLLTK